MDSGPRRADALGSCLSHGSRSLAHARDIARTPLFRLHARRPRLTALLDRDHVAVDHADRASGVREDDAGTRMAARPSKHGLVPGHTGFRRRWGVLGRPRRSRGSGSAGRRDRIHQRLRVGDATERLARPLAELLAEDLEAWPASGIVVLDDHHLLAESKPVEEFLDWLLTLVPMRVLVTTRRRPGLGDSPSLPLRRGLRDRPRPASDDYEEATRVLEGRSTDAIRALVRQAEGWPAVIGLAALSADLAFPEEQASESLYRYFAEEVLRAEPPEVQRLMLAAAVPSAITVRLAEEVLELEDPEHLLVWLRDEDLLHEIPSGEFVFHPLIHDFLRRQLEANDPETLVNLRRRVVADARAHGRWAEAFELSIAAGHDAEAAEIVGRAARELLALGQGETLEKWLGAVVQPA